ncbi:MAG: hypothetical protein JWM80_3430 [Cyanobacteria bacterium RYN_339]|nr:hypothetical protein [Cyanobacteria bacterium RYN_339]
MGPNTVSPRPAGPLAPAEAKAIALDLNARAGENALYAATRGEVPDGRNTSWRISPEPYAIPRGIYEQLAGLGRHLLAFTLAANKLYQESVKGRQPAWVSTYLDQGKPEALIEFQRMNRFKNLIPRVIRPDIVIDEDGRITACELDSVPGGIGMTGSMSHDYASLGYDLIGGRNGLVEGFAALLRDAAGLENPVVAIMVSEESKDYLPEMTWVSAQLAELGLEAFLVRPADLKYAEDGFTFNDRKIDLVYRFFELFDLKNIAKSDLLQYATKKEQVVVTPPYKAYLEEKQLFALFHHPVLRPYWRQELGEESHKTLESLIPRTWLLDPTPLPPQAVIPGLEVNGVPLTDWRQLVNTNKRERQFVVKPSGFSSLAWGSHGVAFGHDLSTPDWEAALEQALQSFPRTPYILQEFRKPAKTSTSYYNFRREEVVAMEGRARLCPYYYVVNGEAQLHGILATICPLDKLAIHGMADAVMAPTRVDDGPAV